MNVNLEEATLSRAYFLYFQHEGMENANLNYAIMVGIIRLHGAFLPGVNFEGCKDLLITDLSKVVDWDGAIVDEKHKIMLRKHKTQGVENIIWCCRDNRYVYREHNYGSLQEAQDAWRRNRQSGAGSS